MRNTFLIKTIPISIVMGIGFYLVSADNPEVINASSHSELFKDKTHSIKVTTQANPANNSLLNNFNSDMSVENPFYEKEAKARLIQISKSFSEDIKYPENSKPIRNVHELDKYTPNKSTPSNRSTNIKDPNSPVISLISSKHQYFSHESIHASATVSHLDPNTSIKVSARLISNGQSIAQAKVSQSTKIQEQFEIEFPPAVSPHITSSDSIRIAANFTIDQQSYEIGTPIRYENVVAEIDHVEQAFVNQAYLHIPVFINTQNTGYHLVSANLYNPENNQALVHLSEQKNLTFENDFIELKAHISALKLMDHAGPYELRDLSLTRMPSNPDYTTQYGEVKQQAFSVNGFPFSDYINEGYINSDSQERLEFLEQLGGKP